MPSSATSTGTNALMNQCHCHNPLSCFISTGFSVFPTSINYLFLSLLPRTTPLSLEGSLTVPAWWPRRKPNIKVTSNPVVKYLPRLKLCYWDRQHILIFPTLLTLGPLYSLGGGPLLSGLCCPVL